MTLLDELLEANRHALRTGAVGTFRANRRLCIVTCVDPRLTRLFPEALGVDRGQAVALRLPGAHIAPGSEALRSLAATVYVNGCEEVLVLAHTDCGVTKLRPEDVAEAMRARGVDPAPYGDLGAFFGLIRDQDLALAETVAAIRAAPFLPRGIPVHSALMDVATGRLWPIDRGYAAPDVGAGANSTGATR
ncbi:MAG TPA: carbonic anhydrase [Anaeromyxobacteraceae bacterium]|nr:carbonic anhydrase [Anaeromyxobacteraceae bacterium]